MEDTRDVRDEQEPVGLEADCECGRRIVGVDIQRPDAEWGDDGDAAGCERFDNRARPAGQGVADAAERRDLYRMKPDLVAEETDGARPERAHSARLTAAKDERTTASPASS